MAWLAGWTYRKSVTLSRASGAVTDYQMKLLVGESSGATGEDVDCNSHCQTDFDDLRFTTSDGTTLLSYWIASITGATPNQLATVWIEFNSIETGATTFYMYYGKVDAPAVSSVTDTMIKGNDGVVGNFDEATSGTGTIDEAAGKYAVTENSADDCAIAGAILSDLYFETRIDEFQNATGFNTAVHQAIVGLFDSASVAALIGTAAVAGPKRRFYVARITTNSSTTPDDFYIIYQNTSNVFSYWSNAIPGWTSGATLIASGAGNAEVRIWSDGTTLFCDILMGGVSIVTGGPASVAIANVKAIANGNCFAWGDYYNNAYGFTQSVDNYYVKQYRDPEPAWGSWGGEEATAEVSITQFMLISMSIL